MNAEKLPTSINYYYHLEQNAFIKHGITIKEYFKTFPHLSVGNEERKSECLSQGNIFEATWIKDGGSEKVYTFAAFTSKINFIVIKNMKLGIDPWDEKGLNQAYNEEWKKDKYFMRKYL